jgi:hypothetical protein
MTRAKQMLAAAHFSYDKPQEQYHQENPDEARPGAGFEDGANGVATADSEREGKKAKRK